MCLEQTEAEAITYKRRRKCDVAGDGKCDVAGDGKCGVGQRLRMQDTQGMCLVLIEAEAITYKKRPEAKDAWHTGNVFGANRS